MKGIRVIAAASAFVGWVYSWYLLRGVRNFYAEGDVGTQPFWLVLLLGLTTTALIATTLTAGTRFRGWPYLSIGSGAGLFGSIILSQFAMLGSVGAGSLANAFDLAFRTRTTLSVAVFIAGIPCMLVLSGITFLLRRPHETSNMAVADAR
ncbi:MAG: hypothetical protein ABR507_00095 [Actinomycetota bacterium]